MGAYTIVLGLCIAEQMPYIMSDEIKINNVDILKFAQTGWPTFLPFRLKVHPLNRALSAIFWNYLFDVFEVDMEGALSMYFHVLNIMNRIGKNIVGGKMKKMKKTKSA